MAPPDPDRRSLVRDVEAYLIGLRATYGDDVVVDPEGTVPATPDPNRGPRPASAAPPGPRAEGRGSVGEGGPRLPASPDRSAARPLDRSLPVARDHSTARPFASPLRPLAPPPTCPPGPQQTSFLPSDAPPLVAPGLRRTGAAEPGVVDFRPGPDIVRGPCRPEVRAETLRALDETEVRGCTKCRLSQARTRTVFGVGHSCARVMFIGEGPGAEEDRTGEPFVGRAGQLLDRIISSMNLRRAEVYIANTVKCRPPENRTPYPDEMEACGPYLRTQLETVCPQVIVALGRPAAQCLLGVNASLGELRGRFHRHRGIPVMVTYHPAYLLRNPDAKKSTWDDVKLVMRFLAATPDPLLLPDDGSRC